MSMPIMDDAAGAGEAAVPEPSSGISANGGQATAGRSCPASYGYGPHVFQRAAEIGADTLYVIGGLYGNPFALDTIEALAAQEARQGRPSQLVFNGDFHWFDTDPAVFEAITRRVLSHAALRGNVETELAGEDDGFGCGCAYPEHVSDTEVERSNRIITRLRQTAMQVPDVRQRLGALPMHAVAQVGHARIAIVHGDANSLAGWDFAHDSLTDPRKQDALKRLLRTAQVDVFACSHTCLPALHCLDVDGRLHGVINNGAAGMPNFSGTRFGIISRIATTPAPREMPVLHEAIWPISGRNVHVAAIAVEYDAAAWRKRFLLDWEAGSPAHESYFRRIENGPVYSPEQAYRQAPINECLT
jgi:hypothetical protein